MGLSGGGGDEEGGGGSGEGVFAPGALDLERGGQSITYVGCVTDGAEDVAGS